MTAGPSEDSTAAAAQAAGEAAEARHQADAQTQHRISGSTVAVEAAGTPDDVAVSWSSTDNAAQPTLTPSSPPAVNSFDRSPSDPT